MKKSIIKKILIAIPVLIVIFLIVVATRPSDFRVTRSALISAPPEAVFPHVNELKKWDAWSPWAKLDPQAKVAFEGPDAGVGSKMAWDGNNNVGAGQMTITESRPSERIDIKLEFFKPIAGVSDTVFTFKPQGNQTEVTWTMSGKNNFFAKAISLFINCEKMVGPQFESGLANMKSAVESASASR